MNNKEICPNCGGEMRLYKNEEDILAWERKYKCKCGVHKTYSICYHWDMFIEECSGCSEETQWHIPAALQPTEKQKNFIEKWGWLIDKNNIKLPPPIKHLYTKVIGDLIQSIKNYKNSDEEECDYEPHEMDSYYQFADFFGNSG